MARLIQTVSTVEQVAPANGYASLGNITRRAGNVACCGAQVFEYNGTNTISINYPGYYEITVTADVVSATPIELSILLDGVPYTVMYGPTAATTPVSVSKSFITRDFQNSDTTISVQNTGTGDATISEITIYVIKVA